MNFDTAGKHMKVVGPVAAIAMAVVVTLAWNDRAEQLNLVHEATVAKIELALLKTQIADANWEISDLKKANDRLTDANREIDHSNREIDDLKPFETGFLFEDPLVKRARFLGTPIACSCDSEPDLGFDRTPVWPGGICLLHRKVCVSDLELLNRSSRSLH